MKFIILRNQVSMTGLHVNLFLKLKQEVSGFPRECQNEQQKLDYIAKYALNEGIQLDYDAIKRNPGLRSLAKICLNSFGEIWTTSQHEAVVVPLRTRGRQVFSVTHGYEKRGKGLSRDQRSHNTNGILGQFVFLTYRF